MVQKSFSRAQVAKQFLCSTKHIDNLVRRGEFCQPTRLGRRVLFLESALNKWCKDAIKADEQFQKSLPKILS